MRVVSEGTVIAGKYGIERPLSQGGMGSLWVARQLQLQRHVAIKIMDPALASTPDGRARFEREAQAVARIQSPNVVQIHDYGVDGDLLYIVMELLQGEDLGKRLKRERRLPLPVVAQLFVPITKALRKAHEAGMIHLDLKPANIFLARDDEDELVKILDFGIAKMIDTGNATETTATGVVLGSVHYMSPEQVRGRRGLDHRSDLWSLGVIAFRALTGELPFGGTQIGDVLVKVCADPIPRASSIEPSLGPEVDAFLLRALERDPNARFQSARELSAALSLLAFPGGPRAPQASVMSEIGAVEWTHQGPPSLIAPQAAPTFAQPAATAGLPHPISTADWRAPTEAGTLTGSPRVSDVATVPRAPAAATPARRGAVLAAVTMTGVIAAVLLGVAVIRKHPARATTDAAGEPSSAPPIQAPALAAAPPKEPTIEVAPAPPDPPAPPAPAAPPKTQETATPAAKPKAPEVTAKAKEKAPAAATPARPKSPPPPPPVAAPPKPKRNEALGF